MENKEGKHLFMETEKITKLLIRFSFPAIIGMFVNALYNIIDRIYIGNIKDVGHLGIAGVGIIFPVTIILFSFALLLSVGTSAFISLKLGEKKEEEAEHILGVSILLGTIISILLTLVVLLFIDKIIFSLGGSLDTFIYAKSYLKYLILGSFSVIMSVTLNFSIRSDGSPKMAMLTLLIGAFINIVLDPIFIFYFNMGVKGAAIATVISQTVSLIWTAYYFLSSHSKIKIRKENINFNLKIMKNICTLGSSVFALQIGFSCVVYFLNIVLRKYGGDISIGAMAIIQAITSFLIMPIFGINQGAQPILGYNYGAQKYDRVIETLYKAIFTATIICVGGFILVRFFGGFLIGIFTKNQELRNLTLHGLRIFTLALPLDGYQIVSSAYFQAVGKPKMSFFMGLLRQVILMIPCLFILSHFFGLNGIWYAAPVSDIIATLFALYLIRKEVQNLKKKRKLC